MRLTLVLLGWLAAAPPAVVPAKGRDAGAQTSATPRLPAAPTPAAPSKASPSPAAKQPSIDGFIAELPGLLAPCTIAVATEVDGMQVTQRTCVSSRSVGELRELFETRYHDAGLYMADEQAAVQMESGVQVTGLDTENLFSYTALLQPSGKNTTVVLARANLNSMQKKSDGVPIAPVVPGASDVTTFRLEVVQAMTYAVRASPAEIKTFYRETLTKAGWEEGDQLVFKKGGQQLTVTVSPGISERYVMVQLQTAPLGK